MEKKRKIHKNQNGIQLAMPPKNPILIDINKIICQIIIFKIFSFFFLFLKIKSNLPHYLLKKKYFFFVYYRSIFVIIIHRLTPLVSTGFHQWNTFLWENTASWTRVLCAWTKSSLAGTPRNCQEGRGNLNSQSQLFVVTIIRISGMDGETARIKFRI